ncbi:MAG: GNAT family N-acetyltransferase [Roseburia sp.]|nr:GNAT family N-acetyltransferase [Roseburia sp.]
MYGAFLAGKLTGFIGVHEEGSMGMLEVFPEYRGRKIGKALETYLINLQLEQGMTPYGQVVEGNEISTQLQKSLGLCPAKTPVYWMESIE